MRKINLNLIKQLLGLALPISLSLGVSASISLVDSFLVADLGASALAAIALSGSLPLLIIATLCGFLTMYGIRVAEADAAGKLEDMQREFGSGLMLSAIAGGLGATVMGLSWFLLAPAGQPQEVLSGMRPFWVLSSISIAPAALIMGYRLALEAIGEPWLGTALAVATVVLNAVFGVILIYGLSGAPALGLTGAGLATLLANCATLAAAVIATRLRRSTSTLASGLRCSVSTITAQIYDGWAAGLQYLLETGASTVAMLLIGLFGAAALAANQSVASVAIMIYMLPLGISVAAGLLVARYTAQGQPEMLKPIIRTALALVTAVMAVAALVFATLGDVIASLFSSDPAVISTALSLFLVFAAMQLFDGVQSVAIGALRGLHDVVKPALITTFCLWLIGLPLAAALGHTLLNAPAGVWIGPAAGLAIASLILLRRLFRRVDHELTLQRP